LDDTETKGIQSAILLDGVKGWAHAGEEYTSLMDEYDPKPWSEGK
jgi:arsenical-resistance protein 2